MLKKFWLLFLIISAVAASAPASALVLNLPDISEMPSLFDFGDENKPVSSSSFIYDEDTGRWSTYCSADGLLLSTDGSGKFLFESEMGYFSFTLKEIGRYEKLFSPGPGRLAVSGNEIRSFNNGFSEWYINSDEGIEHGMDVLHSPPGTGELVAGFDIAGDFIPSLSADGQSICFSDKNGPVFSYGGICATDAEGRVLNSWFGFSGDAIYWEIDDAGAVYPVAIDPIFGKVEKLQSSDYIAAGDKFGYSVSISGDYSIVGAYGNDAAGSGAGAAYIFQKDSGGADNWGLVQRLNSKEYIAVGDNFGISVSLNGDYAIVGAYDNDTAGSGAGAAYIFQKDSGGADNWGLVQRLNSTEYIAAGDEFGHSVSVSGDYAIVGAHLNKTAGGGNVAGAAYIFQKDSGGADNWGLVKRLNSTEYIAAGDEFGHSVSVSGDYAIVGAKLNKTAGGGNVAGAAYIFQKDSGGADNWGLVKRLNSTEYIAAGDYFGYSVSISGDYAIVGAYDNDTAGSGAGAVYIFQKDSGGADNWGLIQRFNSTEYIAAGDYFGASVSISGDSAIVGALGNDAAGSYAGAAYIFQKDSGGADNWGLVKKFQSTEYIAYWDEFGNSVSISGDSAIVGAPGNDTVGGAGSDSGAAYIFGTSQLPSFTSVYTLTAIRITGTDFAPGVQVKIVNDAGAEIAATGETLTGTTQIDCTLDLNGAAAGLWDIVITNADGGMVTFADAYRVGAFPAPAASTSGGGGSNTDTGVGSSNNLKAGDTASFGFEGKGAVNELSVKVNEDTPNLMVTVKKQSYLPSSIANAPDTDVYEYEEVKTYHAGESDVSGGVFEFKVTKSWLSDKGYTLGDVVMLHYKDGVWAALPTVFVKEQGGYYYYSAETPSFSWFAIGIEEGATVIPEAEAEKTQAPAATEILTPVATTLSVQTEAPVPVAENQSSLLMPVILGIVVILLIIIGARLWQRRQKSKYPEWWDKKL
ncbi:PGF-pre-PGF domain-containing protein [Methanochimaera problematica]|nr:PGF-pre-PGF domain-containing protein [Methanoplanus sp. FWC-SCC4]